MSVDGWYRGTYSECGQSVQRDIVWMVGRVTFSECGRLVEGKTVSVDGRYRGTYSVDGR